MIKVAINGFGRIGRPTFKRIVERYPDLSVVAINDLTDNKTLAHLLKYDSVYGAYSKSVQSTDHSLKIGEQEITVTAEKDPAKLPWKEYGVDVVIESTGHFTKLEEATKHLAAGAKKVIISAPCKTPNVPHFVLGVNQDDYKPEKDHVMSMASCTTNCLAPVAKVLHDNFEIAKGLMTTIHSYTNDQRLLDLPHKDIRRARAAALSMIPTTTGAAIAVTKTIPALEGKIHGIAIRIPTPTVSLVDFVAKVNKKTNAGEVNQALKDASQREELKGILEVEDKELVSIDFKGNSHSAIVDAASTLVQADDLVKILAWYDNEWGYSCRLAEFANYIGKKI